MENISNLEELKAFMDQQFDQLSLEEWRYIMSHGIDWTKLRCEEASPASVKTKIDCGKPAEVLVWSNKDGRAYAMCGMCGTANVNDRGMVVLASARYSDPRFGDEPDDVREIKLARRQEQSDRDVAMDKLFRP